MINVSPPFSWRRVAGWLVHALTASGTCFGMLALYAIYEHRFVMAMWCMALAIIIDGVDGLFARRVNVKHVVPEIDGALLDNIVDFFNYTIVPCFFLLVSDVLSGAMRVVCVVAILFASSYQFTRVDAKTQDHFFKGFPSYWNIVVFYLFFWQVGTFWNGIILLVLSVLSFVPIKYVYPTRLEFLSDRSELRWLMGIVTTLWAISTIGLLWYYPLSPTLLVAVSVAYPIFYLVISLYRTWRPLNAVMHLDSV